MNYRFLVAWVSVLLIGSSFASGADEWFGTKFYPIPVEKDHLEFGSPDRAGLNPDSIRVLVWNIKKGDWNGIDTDLEYYGKDRDLMLISEGILTPKMQAVFDSFTGDRWEMGASFGISYHQSPAYPTGTMIGSHAAPTYVQIHRTEDTEPVVPTPKALTVARYPISGTSQELLVLSIHGINAVPLSKLKRHLALAKAEIDAFKGPVLFAGDFNTNLASKVKYLMTLTKSLGLSSIPFRNDERIKVLGQTIDYVFVRGLRLKDSEVLGKVDSSDHKAMLAEFALESR